MCWFFFHKESKDEQWKRAMDYLNVVNELNYMTQIVIMLYEDPNKVFKMDKYLQEWVVLSYVLKYKPI